MNAYLWLFQEWKRGGKHLLFLKYTALEWECKSLEPPDSTTWGDLDIRPLFFVENLILDYFCLKHFSIYLVLLAVFNLNDNLTSVLLEKAAFLPVPPLTKFNFDILVLPEGPALHSAAFSDASRGGEKKDDEIWLTGSWDLEVLFKKVLLIGHNAGRVIIKVNLLPHSRNPLDAVPLYMVFHRDSIIVSYNSIIVDRNSIVVDKNSIVEDRRLQAPKGRGFLQDQPRIRLLEFIH